MQEVEEFIQELDPSVMHLSHPYIQVMESALRGQLKYDDETIAKKKEKECLPNTQISIDKN